MTIKEFLYFIIHLKSLNSKNYFLGQDMRVLLLFRYLIQRLYPKTQIFNNNNFFLYTFKSCYLHLDRTRLIVNSPAFLKHVFRVNCHKLKTHENHSERLQILSSEQTSKPFTSPFRRCFKLPEKIFDIDGCQNNRLVYSNVPVH